MELACPAVLSTVIAVVWVVAVLAAAGVATHLWEVSDHAPICPFKDATNNQLRNTSQYRKKAAVHRSQIMRVEPFLLGLVPGVKHCSVAPMAVLRSLLTPSRLSMIASGPFTLEK